MRTKEPILYFVSFTLLVAAVLLSAYYAIVKLPSAAQLYAYAPHRTCLGGDEQIISLLIQGDKEIFISYLALSGAFVFLFFLLNFLPWYYRFFLFLTGVFVMCCGLGHYIDTLVMNENVYFYKAIIVTVTGKISLATFGYAACLLPKVYRDANKIKALIIKVNKI